MIDWSWCGLFTNNLNFHTCHTPNFKKIILKIIHTIYRAQVFSACPLLRDKTLPYWNLWSIEKPCHSIFFKICIISWHHNLLKSSFKSYQAWQSHSFDATWHLFQIALRYVKRCAFDNIECVSVNTAVCTTFFLFCQTYNSDFTKMVNHILDIITMLYDFLQNLISKH